ncbi:Holliday junction resolvase [Methylomagnum ishizawai]|uniref:Holliday junction resolvase n=1 Tax=Methylomagnum ishizawai TaxID=1760988 RepID=A0A1Y6CYC6_9GAMM|nr:hypothetical protein [Methylomagnum ishizawai]SMF95296.1 Holliday junction resolvase [Methylomagnum ishizawai]
MNTTAQAFHHEYEQIRSLAEQYTEAGFQVSIEPDTGAIPFDLGDYRPDFIAVKGGTGIIVEVKPSSARISVERFHALAEEVARHPGWRFVLVTPDDVESDSVPGLAADLPAWQKLIEGVGRSRHLIDAGEYEPALLYLWGIFEGGLRKRAMEAAIPVERFPVRRAVDHMYSLGEISVKDYDLVLAALAARNRLSHGAIAGSDNQIVHARLAEDFGLLVSRLLETWRQPAH